MIDAIVSLTNVRVASETTFFPAIDPLKHQCIVNVIQNRGKNKITGQEMTDVFTLKFWGKYAKAAALYLDKGSALDIEGVLRSYTKDTGRVKPNGKKELITETQITVRSFEFGANSKKELVKRVGQNIAKAIQEGLLPPNCTITPDYLIAITRPAAYDYNPQLAAQTGRYGNARVFIKGQGFLGNGAVAPMPAAQGDLAQLEAQVAQMKAALVAGAAADVNPFGS